jgi:hypothetical protein
MAHVTVIVEKNRLKDSTQDNKIIAMFFGVIFFLCGMFLTRKFIQEIFV